MLQASFLLLCLAVLFGAWAGAGILYGDGQPATPRWVAPVHGGLASLGLLALLAALGLASPTARAIRLGVGSFGVSSAVLLAAAWLLGGVIAAYSIRRRAPPGLVVALHAGLAVCGITLLLALTTL